MQNFKQRKKPLDLFTLCGAVAVTLPLSAAASQCSYNCRLLQTFSSKSHVFYLHTWSRLSLLLSPAEYKLQTSRWPCCYQAFTECTLCQGNTFLFHVFH